MQKGNQIKLDALMLTFSTLHDGNNNESFQQEWESFFTGLSDVEKKVAADAWFKTIFNTIADIKKIAADIKANGSERERADFNKQLDKIIEHPFFDKNRIAA